MASINNQPFSILIKSTENYLGDEGAKSLGDALKLNTALAKLNLRCEYKRNIPMTSINKPLFSVLIKPTVNHIGDTGATSLGEALKSNTTLTELNLWGEDKRNNTQMTFINNQLFFILIKSTGNIIKQTGEASLSDALKSNTTLTELSL